MTLPRSSGPRRANSLFYQKMPYQLLPYINNNKNIPKIESFSKNYHKISLVENGNNTQNKNNCSIKSRCMTKNYTGEALADNDLPKIILFSSNNHVILNEIDISPLKSLPTPNNPNFGQIFNDKIKLCNLIFNFSRQNFQINGKREKTKALIEIHSLLTDKRQSKILTDKDKNLIFQMISQNIFEQEVFLSKEKSFLISQKSSFIEPSWEHLSIVYKILNEFALQYPERLNISIAKKAIQLMNNPDHNERENLSIFLKNYTKVHQEQFEEIWKTLKNAIIDVINYVYYPFCIDPIISYMTIIFFSNSFSGSSLNYLSQILYTHLLPLFRHNNLSFFFDNLLNLVVHIITNNFNEQFKTIQFLIKFFPHQNGSKQPLFVSAISAVIKTMKKKDLNEITTCLFNFLAMTIKLPNYKLAESSLILLTKQSMQPFISSNFYEINNIIDEPLKWSANCYWEPSIQDQCQNALSMLSNAKIEFMKNYAMRNLEIQDMPKNEPKSNKELAQIWGSLARIASKRYKSVNLAKNLHKIQIEFLKGENS